MTISHSSLYLFSHTLSKAWSTLRAKSGHSPAFSRRFRSANNFQAYNPIRSALSQIDLSSKGGVAGIGAQQNGWTYSKLPD